MYKSPSGSSLSRLSRVRTQLRYMGELQQYHFSEYRDENVFVIFRQALLKVMHHDRKWKAE